jgi:hypothetical protein
MKKICQLLIMVLWTITAHGQVTNSKELNDLRTPTSPGFILMDQAPASVDRPTTPKGLAANILSLQNGGAIEVAPYWLTSHEHLDFTKYTKNGSPVLQTLSVSISTVKKHDTVLLAAGFRTQVLRLFSKQAQTIKDAAYNKISDALDDLTVPGALDTIANNKKLLEKNLLQPTFLVELAYSYLGYSPNSSFDKLQRSRQGAWLTASWHPTARSPVNLIALARYLQNPNFSGYEKDSKMFDFGGRALYTFKSFGFSVEYVNRRVTTNDKLSYDRLAGIIEYKVNSNVYLTATYGKNFDKVNNIIALLGLNFGISSKDNVIQ